MSLLLSKSKSFVNNANAGEDRANNPVLGENSRVTESVMMKGNHNITGSTNFDLKRSVSGVQNDEKFLRASGKRPSVTFADKNLLGGLRNDFPVIPENQNEGLRGSSNLMKSSNTPNIRVSGPLKENPQNSPRNYKYNDPALPNALGNEKDLPPKNYNSRSPSTHSYQKIE